MIGFRTDPRGKIHAVKVFGRGDDIHLRRLAGLINRDEPRPAIRPSALAAFVVKWPGTSAAQKA